MLEVKRDQHYRQFGTGGPQNMKGHNMRQAGKVNRGHVEHRLI